MDENAQAQYAELEAQFNAKIQEAYQILLDVEAIIEKAAELEAVEAAKAAEETVSSIKKQLDRVGNMTLKDVVNNWF